MSEASEEITEKVELPLLTNNEIIEMKECLQWLIGRARMTREDRESYAPVYKARMDKCYGFIKGLESKLGVNNSISPEKPTLRIARILGHAKVVGDIKIIKIDAPTKIGESMSIWYESVSCDGRIVAAETDQTGDQHDGNDNVSGDQAGGGH